MVLIGKCRVIKNDVFDIARRAKEIESGYFIVFNYKKAWFEAHNRAQNGNTFCLALGKTLDARSLEMIRLTRHERSRELFSAIEDENQRLLKAEVCRAQRQAEFALENALK